RCALATMTFYSTSRKCCCRSPKQYGPSPQPSPGGRGSKRSPLMPISSQDALTIAREYAEKYPESARLHPEAQGLLPGGVTHMARTFDPFPIYVDRCVGAHKWDVDGNQYIDYWMGHGAMLLGHAHPAVVEAVREQVARGTHAGGSTRLEIDWARLIMDLVP